MFDIGAIGLMLGLIIVLWGLRNGLVAGFAADELRTPEATRIFLSAPSALSRDDVRWLASQPETRFVQPNTSFFNSRVQLLVPSPAGSPGSASVEVLVLPTGVGDPLIPSGLRVPDELEVILGDDVVAALGESGTSRVTVSLPRAGDSAQTELALSVIGTVEVSKWFPRAIFLNPVLVRAIEGRGYVDGIVFDGSRPDFGVAPGARFPTLRLYATSIELVPDLVRKVNAKGWNAQARQSLIQERLALDHIAGVVFWTIFVFALASLIMSTVVSLVVRSIRLSAPLTRLRMVGLGRLSASMVPLAQSVAIATIGALVSVLAAHVGAWALNRILPQSLAVFGVVGTPCVLDISSILVVCVGGIGVAAIAGGLVSLLLDQPTELRVRSDV